MISVYPSASAEIPAKIFWGGGGGVIFGGGGGILKKNSCQAIPNKNWIPALTNWGENYPAPIFDGKKLLQNSMVAGIHLTSPRRPAGLIFRD